MAYTRHQFGKQIDFRFIPLAEDEEQSAFELVSARIFSDEPTETQQDTPATLGFIQAVTTWTNLNPNEYQILFDDIADPDPHSYEEYETYFVTVNYRLESGGATIFTTEQIFIWRADGLTSRISVTPDDIYAHESKIEDLAPSPVWVQNKITAAIQAIDDKLAASQGVKKRFTFNREALNRVVTLLAVALCCRDLAGEGNQFWWEKYREYKAEHETALAVAQLGVDIQQDNRPTPDETLFSGGVILVR